MQTVLRYQYSVSVDGAAAYFGADAPPAGGAEELLSTMEAEAVGVTVGAVEDVASGVEDVAAGVWDVVVAFDDVAGATELVEASVSVEGAVAEGSAPPTGGELVLVDGSTAAWELVEGAAVVGELVEEATGGVLAEELVVGSPSTGGVPSTVSVGVDGSEASGSW